MMRNEELVESAAGRRRVRLRNLSERALAIATSAAGVVPLLGLAAMIVILLSESFPALRFNGWSFFSSTQWSIGNTYGQLITTGGVLHIPGAHYGAWTLIAGTLESSALAIVFAFPVALGAAIIVVEKLPRPLAAGIGLCLEILAGVPSVVIGLWGIFSLGPFLAHNVYPWLSHTPDVPVLGLLHGAFVSNGQGLLTGSLVLAAMIVPLMAATARDLLNQVPTLQKEGAMALGMTETESFMAVQARWVRSGVIGSAVLGLGRALGETIAIAMVTGSVLRLTPNIYGSMTTIAAAIVTQLDSAEGDPSGLAIKSLAEAALVLMVITLVVNAVARVLVNRSAERAGIPAGRQR